PVSTFTLPAHSVAVWQFTSTASTPEVGSIGPTLGQSGVRVTLAGKGFGTSTGTVLVGTTTATINSWSSTSVIFTVPNVTNGVYNVTLKNSSGTAANTIQHQPPDRGAGLCAGRPWHPRRLLRRRTVP